MTPFIHETNESTHLGLDNSPGSTKNYYNFNANLSQLNPKFNTDLIAAKKVADFLGTVHHTYTYTIQEGLDAIRQVSQKCNGL